MAYANILYAVEGPLALITLNRPQRRNAVSLAMLEELHTALDTAEQDAAVRAVALTGAGAQAFASGSDLGEVAQRDLPAALEPIVQGFAERLERSPKPTIAAVNGVCFGGGLELALGCDLRVASTRARFATPEGRLGIIPGGGATQRLPRLVGKAWALEMLLMGEVLDASLALEVGLVTRVVEPEHLLSTVRRMAERIAGYAPLVPRYTKTVVHAGMEGSLAAGLALEKFAQAGLCATADKAEGIAAFLEKRAPRWSGS